MPEPIVMVEASSSSSAGSELQRRLLTLATADNVPSGVLHRCAAFSSRIRQFTGASDAPRCSQAEWDNLYSELAHGQLFSRSLPQLDEVWHRATSYLERGLTPIFIADIRFEIVRPRFWAAIRRHLAANLAAHEFPMDTHLPADMVESTRAFFATSFVKTEYEILNTLPRVHRGLRVEFIVPRTGFFSNHALALETIEVDFGQGAGYQAVQPDQAITIQYAEPGLKPIRVRAATTSGLRYASFDFEVALTAAPPADAYWNLIGYKPFPTSPAAGHAWVFYGSVNGVKKTALTRPVIISEGFPGNYSIDYLWEKLNQQNFASSMLAQGLDLIVLGFANGSTYIQANAFVAVSCIVEAIRARVGNAPLIVGGASMGGLVTRYALTWMEKNGLAHQTARYFTMDSPHGGATIPVSVQAFVQYFSKARDSAKPAADQLASPAAQQMLLQWVPPYDQWQPSGFSFAPSPERARFIDDLAAQGWMPRRPASAALADGWGNGRGNPDTPGMEAVNFQATACIWDNSYVFPLGGTNALVAKMECSKVDSYTWTITATNGLGYDSAPGGLTDAFQALYDQLPGTRNIYATHACFIPTVSACSIRAGGLYTPVLPSSPSDFNKFQVNTAGNVGHIALTPELAQFLSGFILGALEERAEEADAPAAEATKQVELDYAVGQ